MNSGEDAVSALLDILNREDAAYMLVGSFSSNAYGEPRSTKDADFVVNLDAEMRNRVLDQLPDDFKVDYQATLETITWNTRQILTVPGIPFEIELFDLGRDPFDSSRFSRRVESIFHGRKVWLPTAEDVVVQKLRWAKLGSRAKDYLDALGVVNVRGENLDWSYIDTWCDELGLSELKEKLRNRENLVI